MTIHHSVAGVGRRRPEGAPEARPALWLARIAYYSCRVLRAFRGLIWLDLGILLATAANLPADRLDAGRAGNLALAHVVLIWLSHERPFERFVTGSSAARGTTKL